MCSAEQKPHGTAVIDFLLSAFRFPRRLHITTYTHNSTSHALSNGTKQQQEASLYSIASSALSGKLASVTIQSTFCLRKHVPPPGRKRWGTKRRKKIRQTKHQKPRFKFICLPSRKRNQKGRAKAKNERVITSSFLGGETVKTKTKTASKRPDQPSSVVSCPVVTDV